MGTKRRAAETEGMRISGLLKGVSSLGCASCTELLVIFVGYVSFRCCIFLVMLKNLCSLFFSFKLEIPGDE